MSKFQIVAPHLPSECDQALDAILDHDPTFLDEAWLGCSVGDHTVYAVVDAPAVEEARDRIPEFLRPKTRVVEVIRPTIEMIKEHREQVI